MDQETLVITHLPQKLRAMPREAMPWKLWRDRMIRFRAEALTAARDNEQAQQALITAARADGLFWLALFGVHFEPRDRAGRPKGWYPSIPMPFQARLWRFLEQVLAIGPGSPEAELGRADAIIEKARGMAGSYTICQFCAHKFQTEPGFTAGLVSYKADLVDKSNDPSTLFYKVLAQLGLQESVPEARFIRTEDGTDLLTPLRLPGWAQIAGWSKKQRIEMALAHPTLGSYILGYTTTERTGTGGRLTVMINDEAAKFEAFRSTWDAQSAVTDHRIALSSADKRHGPAFRDLARSAEDAGKRQDAGPSFLRLEWDMHPEQDLIWRAEMEARHAQSPAALAREYDLDYEAGAASGIYRKQAERIALLPLTFKPTEQSLDFCIDPGVRNNTAFHLVSYDPISTRYALLESYANSGYPAEFYSTIITGTPLYSVYDYTDEDEDVMATFRRWGHLIRFYVGDPAGNQRSQATATTFYEELAAAVYRLTDGRRSIAVATKTDEGARLLGRRIEDLRWLLGHFDVADTPRCRRTLAALKEYAFRAEDEDRPGPDTEPKAVQRFWGHDLVTALEFLAVHRRTATKAAAVPRAKPVRATLSGKVRRQGALWVSHR